MIVQPIVREPHMLLGLRVLDVIRITGRHKIWIVKRSRVQVYGIFGERIGMQKWRRAQLRSSMRFFGHV